MFAHAHEGVVSRRCRFALGGLRRPQAGGLRRGRSKDGAPRHQQRHDQRRRVGSGEQDRHPGDRRPGAVLGKEFPELYEKDFEPISGGYYAVNPSTDDAPPCATDAASEVAGNAFYCSTEDVVAWDAEELLPELQTKFGDFVIPVVMAHEWGHAVQARSNFTARTVTRELQADCFAGAWSKHAQDDGVFDVNAADLDTALAGILDLRDTPGTSQHRSERARQRLRPGQRVPGRLRQRLGQVQGLPRRRAVVLELPFSHRGGRGARGHAPDRRRDTPALCATAATRRSGMVRRMPTVTTRAATTRSRRLAGHPVGTRGADPARRRVRREDLDAARGLPGGRLHGQRHPLHTGPETAPTHLAWTTSTRDIKALLVFRGDRRRRSARLPAGPGSRRSRRAGIQALVEPNSSALATGQNWPYPDICAPPSVK